MTVMIQKILSLSDDSTKMNYPLMNALDFRVSQRKYELTDSIRSVQLTEDKLVIVLNEDAIKMIGIREYHVVIAAAKDSKSLGKCLKAVTYLYNYHRSFSRDTASLAASLFS